MHDVFRVQVVDSIADSIEHIPGDLLLFDAVAADVVEQSPILCILQYDISALVFLVESILQHLDNVRVIQLHVNLHFIDCDFATYFFNRHCLAAMKIST